MDKIIGDEIIIANSGTFKGYYGLTGKPIAAGIQAYIDMVNSEGGIYGRSLRLVHIDDEYDADKAVECFRELVEKENAFAYVSHFGAPAVNATLDLIKRKGIPTLGFATSIGRIYVENAQTYEQGSNCYPIQPIYIVEGRMMVAHCRSLFHASKIAVLYTDDDTGRDLTSGIQVQCRRIGMNFVSYMIALDMSNLAASIEKIKSEEDADCVIVAASQAFFARIVGEMADQDLSRPVLTTYLNSIVTVAEETDKRVRGKFDIYAMSWLNYQDERMDNLEESALWLGEYAMNGYAHCGWICTDFLCEGLKRMGPGIPRWEDFPAVMERAPIKIAFGGKVDYSGGRRIGTTDLCLVQLDLGMPTGWRLVEGLKSMNELLGTF